MLPTATVQLRCVFYPTICLLSIYHLTLQVQQSNNKCREIVTPPYTNSPQSNRSSRTILATKLEQHRRQ